MTDKAGRVVFIGKCNQSEANKSTLAN